MFSRTRFLFALALLPCSASFALPETHLIEEAIRRANDYYLWEYDEIGPADWKRSTYHTGNLRAWEVLGEQAYFDRTFAFAEGNEYHIGHPWPIPWGATTNRLHADSHTAGQIYLDLYLLDPSQTQRKTKILQAMYDLVNNIDRNDPSLIEEHDDDWHWIDAFYMAAPTLARAANIENDEVFRAQLRAMYDDMKVTRGLFDPSEGLWFRDGGYLTKPSPNGEKMFWSRGNGWVIAALPRILEQLPADHPDRSEFTGMLQTMAAALLPLQGDDGFWRSNLLDPDHYPNPETSGTAFFTYAMAWGIRNGLLDEATYLPCVEKAWTGLTTVALKPSGFLGYVQGPAREPGGAKHGQTKDYGVGAFLLAGTEILLLAGGPPELMPDAGVDETRFSENGLYEYPFSFDASGHTLREGRLERVTWWLGETFLGEGEQLDLRLPHGEHGITARFEHSSGAVYESQITRTISTSTTLPVVAVTTDASTGNAPEGAIDGDIGTRWSSKGRGLWLECDLGSPATINGVALAFHRGDQRIANFDIQVSSDGSNWQTVVANAFASGDTWDYRHFAVPPVVARWIRYVGHGSDVNEWNGLTEIVILGPMLDPGADLDPNGLPDAWESARVGATGSNPQSDPFGKGRSLALEYLLGSDPADPSDYPQASLVVADGQATLSFEGRAAFGPGYTGKTRYYSVLVSPDLTSGDWTPHPDHQSIPARNLEIRLPVDSGGATQFYKLDVRLEDN